MRFDAAGAIQVRLVLAGLFLTSLGCSSSPAVMSPGSGGAVSMGLGGQAMAGSGGTYGTGGALGTGGSGVIFSTDPTDTWQTFAIANQGAFTGTKLDILFMVDNSQSMQPLQQKLLDNFPVFMNVLKALPYGLPDIHVAVVSSDTGPGAFDIPDRHCSYLGDQGMFQNAPRGTCTQSPFIDPSSRFLVATNNQAQKNYNGDIADAFKCIALLGDQGCGFEGQLKSVRWALDPRSPPPGNAGFLRSDAYLAVVLITNEDDCSLPDDSTLIDTTQELMSDPLGPLWSFRCNEFGHLCNINGTLQPPPRGAATNLTDCVSNDTATGRLTRIADEIAFLKSLKADPNQILVAAITGPVTPYNINMVSRTTSHGVTEDQPDTGHSCMQSTGEYADPAVRLAQWVKSFQYGRLLPICTPSFAPALDDVANHLAHNIGPTCVTGPFPIDPSTGTYACRVVDRNALPDGRHIDTVVPPCATGATGGVCWTLMPGDGTTCPTGSMHLEVNRMGAAGPTAGTAITCDPCPADRSEIGCR
jgi:hypothetical protein